MPTRAAPRPAPFAADLPQPSAARGGRAPDETADEGDFTIPLPGRDPVSARRYGRRPVGGAAPLVLHFHGGTFTCGGLDDGRNVARLLARTGAVVVSLAYPLAPFPEPVEVGFAAMEWLYRQRAKWGGKDARLYLAGEEAGGNLAAAVGLMARDGGHPPVAGQILLSPMLDPCAGTASLRKASTDAATCPWAAGWQEYLRQPAHATHPYAVPGASLRLRELAPTLVLVGSDDAMRDEALDYAGRLREAGIAVTSGVLPSRATRPGALYDPGCRDAACADTLAEHLRAFFANTSTAPVLSR